LFKREREGDEKERSPPLLLLLLPHLSSFSSSTQKEII